MPSVKLIPLILIAGMLGTLCRYAGLKLAAAHAGSFPFGTAAVNIAGAFLAGFLFAAAKNRFHGLEPWLPVLLIGFLGAFTTFSTLMLETVNMMFAGAWNRSILNLLGQNAAGLLAAAGGIALGRVI